MAARRNIAAASLLALALLTGIGQAETITVQSGDSLWTLARAHNTTIAELRLANNLSSDNLSIGQKLLLPGAESQRAATHQVVSGDTVWDLAMSYDLTVEQIAQWNNLSGYRLQIDQILRLSPPAAGIPQDHSPGSASAPHADELRRYTVQPGDSLYEIARAHNVDLEALIAWNGLDGSLIHPGQALVLQPGETPSAERAISVTVQPGDSLWNLARAHGSTVDAIARANNISSSTTLRVGTELTIPARGAPSGEARSASTTQISQVQVRPGDNLWAIARHHGSSVDAIMRLNNLPNDRLSVGQVLKIEIAASAAVAAAPAPTEASSAPIPTALVAEANRAMVWPLVGNITSEFGWRRLSVGGNNMHSGLDIDGNHGDPIRSATSGTVVSAGWRAGLGYTVIIADGNTEYWYAHTSAMLVSAGDQVGAGDVIARVGATGIATGPHLHFEIRVDGRAIDPLPILEARAVR